jgi:vitamin B12 transporter
LTLTVLYLSPWADVDRAGTTSGLRANGYVVANLAATYGLGNGVSLFGRINNLLDRTYQDPTGFQRPGLGAFAGIKLAFDAPTLER